MPKDKAELTKNGKIVSSRLVESHAAEWDRLGGTQWLREMLDKSIKERENEKAV